MDLVLIVDGYVVRLYDNLWFPKNKQYAVFRWLREFLKMLGCQHELTSSRRGVGTWSASLGGAGKTDMHHHVHLHFCPSFISVMVFLLHFLKLFDFVGLYELYWTTVQ